jgi:hypothetical protein
VSLGLLGLAGLLLSVERVCYAWIARAPASFRDWCAQPLVGWLGEPVVVVRALFVAFKALQYTVFAGWCNTGDWVESCSALAEGEDGTLTLLAFAERGRAATARRGGSG